MDIIAASKARKITSEAGYTNIKVMYSSNGEIMYTKVSW